MTTSRNLPSLPIIALAIVLGLAACMPSTPDATVANEADVAAPPSMDAPKASASEHVKAAVDAINPMTSPRETVIASMHKLMDARSYHVSMKMSGGPKSMMANEMDFVAPDRFRVQMAGVGTQTIIGDTMHMSMQGRSMKMPMPKDATKQWRDPESFKQAEAGMTAERLGSEAVDGISAQKYSVRQTMPTASEYTLWIGPDGLPLQVRMNTDIDGAPSTMTMRYSRINDPTLSIDAP